MRHNPSIKDKLFNSAAVRERFEIGHGRGDSLSLGLPEYKKMAPGGKSKGGKNKKRYGCRIVFFTRKSESKTVKLISESSFSKKRDRNMRMLKKCLEMEWWQYLVPMEKSE